MNNIKLYEINNEGKVKCLLCPHYCLLEKNKIGRCGARKNNGNNEIELINYGALTHIAVEPIEKKPIFNFLSRTNTLSLGGKNCSLFCVFCENFKISQENKDIKSKYYSINDIINLAKDNKCQSICMTYNEPSISYEYLLDLAKESHKNDLKFIIKTNGYVNKDPWKEICLNTDAMNIDWKGSENQYKKKCGVKIKDKKNKNIILSRIEEAYKMGVHIEISIPLFCDSIDEIKEFNEFGYFLSGLDKNIFCHLLKIYPNYHYENCKTISHNDINKIYSTLSNYLTNIRI